MSAWLGSDKEKQIYNNLASQVMPDCFLNKNVSKSFEILGEA